MYCLMAASRHSSVKAFCAFGKHHWNVRNTFKFAGVYWTPSTTEALSNSTKETNASTPTSFFLPKLLTAPTEMMLVVSAAESKLKNTPSSLCTL